MKVKDIPIDKIFVSEYNVRKDMDAGTENSTLDDLANSINKRGLISPITVRKVENKTYELILGQRRLLACKKLGWTTIQAIIREINDNNDIVVLSLIENVHRADLNPIDKANAFKLIVEHVHSPNASFGSPCIEGVSRETGVSVPTIKRYLSMLDLHPVVQDTIKIEGTRSGHYGILALERLSNVYPPDEHEEVIKEIKGLDKGIQAKIITESGGDMRYLRHLKRQAIEGELNTKVCMGIGSCKIIPEELKAFVQQKIKEFNEMKIKQKAGDEKITDLT